MRQELLAEAKAEREDLLQKILAIGYPRLTNQTQIRPTKPAQRQILTPGYRPDLRPADPPAEEVAPEATEISPSTVEAALNSLLVPPTFAINSNTNSSDN